MNKKKMLLLLTIWVVLMIPLGAMIRHSASPMQKVKGFQASQTYTVSGLSEISGYDVEKNTFSVNGYDPQIRVKDLREYVGSIRILFYEPLKNNLAIQVFYRSANQGYEEDCSKKIYLYEGNKEVIFNIPEGIYDEIRLDMDGSFSLENIQLCAKNVEYEFDGYAKIPAIAYVTAGIGLFAFLFLCIYLLQLPRKVLAWTASVRAYDFSLKKNLYSYCCLLLYVLGTGLLTGLYLSGNHSLTDHGYTLIFQLAAATVLLCFLLFLRSFEKNIAKIAFCLILFIGTAYALTLPVATNVSTDDEVHYRRVVTLSHTFDRYLTEADEKMYVKEFLPEYDIQTIERKTDELEDLAENGRNIQISRYPEELFVVISYLPAAIGLLIGRGIGLSFAGTFLLGRWMNVLVYSVVMYYAIKKLKSGQLILSVIALLPTNLFMAASYGYDAWLTCFTALSVSYIISVLQDPGHIITTKEMGVIWLGFVLGLFPKAVYFPLLGLCLLVTKKHFPDQKNYRKYLLCSAAVAFFVLITFAVPFLLSGQGGNDMRGGAEVDSMRQIAFILKNPLGYTKILLHFLQSYLSVENQIGLLASNMHMGFSPHYVLVFLTLTVAVFCDRNEADANTCGSFFRTVTLVSVIMALVLVVTALYVAFTAVASPKVAGCQPRYLMPFVFPLSYFVFHMKLVKTGNKNEFYAVVLAIMCVVLFSTADQNWISKMIV